jgi:GT2 family glycosyltransferase
MTVAGREPRPLVTVVVVNYNGAGRLGPCLDGLASQSGVVWEAIVIDNASSDGSAAAAEGRPGVSLVRNSVNVGFGAACNQAAGSARGEYLAFLNFDSVPEAGWLAALVSAAQAGPDTGAVQGVILSGDGGQVDTAGNLLHFLGFSWAPAGDRPPAGAPYEIAAGSGASLLVPRATFVDVGGFWDEMFLYCEDTDLSWRLRLRGLRVIACPAARSRHDHEFHRNPGKFFHLERNRWLMITANYEWRSLALLAPALLASELAVLAVAARGGWLRHKLRALGAVVAAVPAIRSQRRRVQSSRRVSDRQLMPGFEVALGTEFGADVARVSAHVLGWYARCARLPVGRRDGQRLG